MKAKDLIKELQSVDPDTDVCMSDNGYVMGFREAVLGREIPNNASQYRMNYGPFIPETEVKCQDPKNYGIDQWPEEKIVLLS